MKLTSRIPKRGVFYAYLNITNGINKLTDQEIKLLSELMWSHMQFLSKDAYSLPGIDLFSTENKKIISEQLNITLANFYNLVSALKKKKFILEEGRTGLKLSKPIHDFTKEVLDTGKASVTFDINIAES